MPALSEEGRRRLEVKSAENLLTGLIDLARPGTIPRPKFRCRSFRKNQTDPLPFGMELPITHPRPVEHPADFSIRGFLSVNLRPATVGPDAFLKALS